MNFTLHCGKCELLLKDMPDNSMDSCVTDPPYELKFMGRKWDGSGIAFSVEMWKEVYRVLKPGAHLLAFGATRTQHRMVCAIEDAGFQIRDTLMWIYGSGYPKSKDISKAIDKAAGVERKQVGIRKHPTLKDLTKLEEQANAAHGGNSWSREWPITEAGTDDAKTWDGWGTALKPAAEPIVMARKPLEPGLTIDQNVIKWGTGALNIAACKIPGEPWRYGVQADIRGGNYNNSKGRVNALEVKGGQDGRWPANVIHDGSEEVVKLFPVNETPSGIASGPTRGKMGTNRIFGPATGDMGDSKFYGDTGSTARFFYVPKTSQADRHEGTSDNNHETVKPTQLMQYLVVLATPPNGTCLDIFMGSGTTGKACAIEDYDFVGVDQSQKSVDTSRDRIQFIIDHKDLFGTFRRPK